MEELPGSVRLKKVSFKTQRQTPTYTDGKLESMCWSRGHEQSMMKEKPCFSSYYQSSEQNSRIHAMEFLCRSWSPFASDFPHIFSSQKLQLPQRDNISLEEHEEKVQVQGAKTDAAQGNIETINKVDNVWRWLTIQRPLPSDHPMHTPFDNNNGMSLKNLNKWFKEKSLSSLLRWHNKKKREEVRLSRAKVEAALSVARLASAVAGFAANNSSKQAQDINHMISKGALEWDGNLSVIVAAAAALVATVCAEAAESAGAHRTHVASVVNSGLAAQTPADMISLTASTATCLRGAATLKSRAMADASFPKNQQLLNVGVQLAVLMPSGHRENRLVSVFPKRKQLIVSFGKKYLGGLLTRSKQYTIMDVMEETMGGNYLLTLKTNNGDIKLLFEDEKQSIVWITTISNLLHRCTTLN